jgi:origin recognition complex subunit 4
MKQPLILNSRALEDLTNILRRSIYQGENNSALVIGSRGSGKSHLINASLVQIRNELHKESCSSDVIIIRLSGCAQSDDKSALLEITRQLKLENCFNGKVFGSFADSFEFLLRSLRAGDGQSKPIVFIMDEFDLFTRNKSQLLLYTLLNTIQTACTVINQLKKIMFRALKYIYIFKCI